MSKLTITPIYDRVLVTPGTLDEVVESKRPTIILTEKIKVGNQGRVVAVGPGAKGPDGKIIPMPVKVGDFIHFSPYGPEAITVDGQEYLILNASGILAIISKDKK